MLRVGGNATQSRPKLSRTEVVITASYNVTWATLGDNSAALTEFSNNVKVQSSPLCIFFIQTRCRQRKAGCQHFDDRVDCMRATLHFHACTIQCGKIVCFILDMYRMEGFDCLLN